MSTHEYIFAVPHIPDCSQYRYSSQASGQGARTVLYEHWSSFLHMLSRLRPGEIAVTLRADFDPGAAVLQRRLLWTVRVAIDGAVTQRTVDALVRRGPVSPFYDFLPAGGLGATDPPRGAAVELLRCEEALMPRMTRADNPALEQIKLYYTVYPFKPREQSDYLMLDRLMSRVDEPVRLELRIEPAQLPPVRATLAKYIALMMSINQGREDLFLENARPEASRSLTESPHELPILSRPVKRDPVVDKFLAPLGQLQEKLREPHLRVDARVFARSGEVATLVASILAESAFTEGQYQAIEHDSQSPWLEPLLHASQANLPFSESYSSQWFETKPAPALATLRQLARMAPVEELKGLWHLPVGGAGSPCCMYKSSDPGAVAFADELRGYATGAPPKRAARQSLFLGRDLEMGVDGPGEEPLLLCDLLQGNGSRGQAAALDLSLLRKHLFVSGVPGSGKTSAMFNLLVQLHRYDIPFLVIEPAKTEYRLLKALGSHPDPHVRDLAATLEVYTPGDERLSPLRFNPLEHMPETTRYEHIDALINCLKAGMEMFGPMEAVISEALEEVYREASPGTFPTMLDLLAKVRAVVRSKGYEGEVLSNVTAATEVRIGGLTRRNIGRIFEERRSRPTIERLMRVPAVIELDHMGSANACLMTLFLLAAMREQIKTRSSGCALTHVVIIEEAHNVVGKIGLPGQEARGPDPKAHAAEYITRMLAEMRALGEAIVIVDQLPSAVAAEVVKTTGVKIALRQVSQQDREELGAAMLLDPEQVLELARLRVGEAYLYHEELHAPRRVRCLDTATYLGLSDGLDTSGRQLGRILAGDPWFDELLAHQLERVAEQLLVLNKAQLATLTGLHACERNLQTLERREKSDVTSADIAIRIDELERRWLELLDGFFDRFEDTAARIEGFGSEDLLAALQSVRTRLEQETLMDGNDIRALRDQLLGRLSALAS